MANFPKKTTKAQRGFSLIEIAIVLGIAGTVIGGIWVAVAASRSNMLSVQLSQQTSLLVNNVRQYYAGRGLPAAAIAAATFTVTMRDAGVFPGDMCNSQCKAGTTDPGNGFNGLTQLSIPNVSGAPYTEFLLTYSNLPKKACVEVGEALSQNASTTGLTFMKITSGADTTSFPLTLVQLNSNCTATNNTLRMRYRIRL